ncbi:uncharacterized protein L3040_006590 [Drepanopeziza brunnea f. sp. 'multigermtubi']|uniref:SGNH hydrolase-type esterase domain-containing protein n=1 Tax=Marssonina brunnea f. sp. multigermtubi (strain MB_m1) TaxID=1072389 RepID=K1XE33_MARBU|nr:uncharacterized protein MBM_02340 [Drepanopeziza brunnea f. sp. 'multigermtubi' MB_m1]EKD19103.1 hypothetical protein MBM_02340 [Drepanopeziza brunnea f. sp. 'multigermtubi' MB_m1]KAJ5038912.1 hypothetical protein L3040_006590 [Drepanopeziza brunnea f. sp. 'multigermtubi']
MHFSGLYCQLAIAAMGALASPVDVAARAVAVAERATKPAAFFLVGDSTTAAQKGGSGGWGDGFLGTLVDGAKGTNFGDNGATTVSFVEEGFWDPVMAALKENVADFDCYVTIQFGHNDQKPAKGISIEQYSTNLKNFADQVTAAGGTPILVTPLARRKYKGDVELDLVDQVTATLAVATDNKVAVIDLNAASMKYLNAIGEANARNYDPEAGDETHLNPAGTILFGNMVAGLISESQVGDKVKAFISEDPVIAADIASGTYVLPSA